MSPAGNDPPPSPFAWAGGAPALERLFERFYERVHRDPTLAPAFAHAGPEHARHVAAFVGEVFGGPPHYTEAHGGHPAMIGKHVGRALTEPQRRQWLALLLACADELGLPSDPEFRSTFVAYLEWGTRLAVINSRPGTPVDPDAPMPAWGWGEVKGPYRP